MRITKRAVKIHQLSGRITDDATRNCLRELQQYAESERPRVVLDCSRLSHMDSAAMLLLLSCLEEAMKNKGDLRLASLQPHAEASLRSAGLGELFEVYATPEHAVQSFQQRAASIAGAPAEQMQQELQSAA